MTLLHIKYKTDRYYSEILKNNHIVIGFATQPNDKVKYEEITNDIANILEKTRRENLFVEDIINRLKNCPVYFKSSLADSLFIIVDSEIIEGSSIHSIREDGFIKVFYKQKPCVTFDYFSFKKCFNKCIIIFIAIISLFTINYIFKECDSENKHLDKIENTKKENINKKEQKEDSSIVLDTLTKEKDVHKDTVHVAQVDYNKVEEIPTKRVSGPSSPSSSNQNNPSTSNTDIQEPSNRAQRIILNPLQKKDNQNNSLKLFENLKQKGDDCYSAYYNGNEKSRVEAIRYYKQALEIKKDQYIEKRLDILQNIR